MGNLREEVRAAGRLVREIERAFKEGRDPGFLAEELGLLLKELGEKELSLAEASFLLAGLKRLKFFLAGVQAKVEEEIKRLAGSKKVASAYGGQQASVFPLLLDQVL